MARRRRGDDMVMGIGEWLQAIATEQEGKGPARSRELVQGAARELARHIPGGLVVKASFGRGRPTFTPWIAILDPDETHTPQEGIYVVYLFAGDFRSVTLSLMQGITRLSERLGRSKARVDLSATATKIRVALSTKLLHGLDTTMRLGSKGFRQLAYEAGNIAAKRYEISNLPSDDSLVADLRSFLDLYQEAILVKHAAVGVGTSARSKASIPPRSEDAAAADPLSNFKPKSDAEYLAVVRTKLLRKSRRHERLISEFGEWVAGRGLSPVTTEHPKDLVVRGKNLEWLVEAKVLYQGNATDAIRAALGQLFTYRYFLYAGRSDPQLLALFSEPVGTVYVEFLETLGVTSVWKAPDGWTGSPTARAKGLVE